MTNTEMSSEVPVKTTILSCTVCGENPSKYRCPRCFVQTCCLSCVKQHKMNDECSGVRDKTGYVAVKSFTDTNLLNDYRFLEEGGRKSDNAGRDFLSKTKRIPKRFHQLVRQARQRGIDLKLLPYPMTRRKINTSYYMFKTKQIMWHLVWCFAQAGETFTDKLVKESIPLEEQLQKYLHPTKSDPINRHKLQKYVNVGIESCHLYLRVECLPANIVRYHRLDAHKSITDNLAGKCVVEFPKIFVLVGDSDSVFKVITEEEEQKLCKSAKKYSFNISKKQNSKGLTSEPEDLQKTNAQKDTNETQIDCCEESTEVQTNACEDSTEVQTNACEESTEVQTNACEESTEVQTNACEDSTEVQTNACEESTEVQTNACEESIDVQTNDCEESTDVQTNACEESTDVQTNACEESTEVQTNACEESTEVQTNACEESTDIQTDACEELTNIQTNACEESIEVQTHPCEELTVQINACEESTEVQTRACKDSTDVQTNACEDVAMEL